MSEKEFVKIGINNYEITPIAYPSDPGLSAYKSVFDYSDCDMKKLAHEQNDFLSAATEQLEKQLFSEILKELLKREPTEEDMEGILKVSHPDLEHYAYQLEYRGAILGKVYYSTEERHRSHYLIVNFDPAQMFNGKVYRVTNTANQH